jgi:hypothetical protein
MPRVDTIKKNDRFTDARVELKCPNSIVATVALQVCGFELYDHPEKVEGAICHKALGYFDQCNWYARAYCGPGTLALVVCNNSCRSSIDERVIAPLREISDEVEKQIALVKPHAMALHRIHLDIVKHIESHQVCQCEVMSEKLGTTFRGMLDKQCDRIALLEKSISDLERAAESRLPCRVSQWALARWPFKRKAAIVDAEIADE